MKVIETPKYVKLYSDTTSPHNIRKYYFAIVEKQTGNVYIPTGEGQVSKTAKVKGNIYDEDNGLTYVTYQGVTTETQYRNLKDYQKYPDNLYARDLTY